MKKFNKSKVIIPALAMIALTTAASATGTVAWFTANRATEVNTGAFVAFDDNRGLSIKATAGTGTSVPENSNVVTPSGSLTDGSYDFTDVWTDVAKDNGDQPDSFVKAPTLVSGAKDANGNDVYYAVQWTYTIGLTNTTGTLAKSVDVMFDLSSEFTNTVDNSTASGFRIAMQCGEGVNQKKLVFSNNSNASDSNRKKHINTEGSIAEFGSEYLTYISDYQKGTDGATGDNDNKKRAEYLGTITAATGTLTVNCTAWYEGNDTNVVSGKSMSSITTKLKFYARNVA